MTTNRLAVRAKDSALSPPDDKAERQKFWIERGNRILWGREATSKGDFLEPKPHLHWVCVKDSYSIEPRR
jgi:hypothetical protein